MDKQQFPESFYENQEKSKMPRRKVVAAGAGGGVAGNIAVILAYYYPQMPGEVIAAYTGLLVTLVAVITSYLVAEK